LQRSITYDANCREKTLQPLTPHACDGCYHTEGTKSGPSVIGGGTFFKEGGTSVRQTNYRKFLWFELATVTSQALKYDAITYTQHEGLNYSI